MKSWENKEIIAIRRGKSFNLGNSTQQGKFFFSILVTFNTLNWIDDDGYSPFWQCLKALLRVNIDSWQPATKAWMWVVPSYHHFWPAGLFKHVKHLCLEYWINRFYTNTLKRNKKISTVTYTPTQLHTEKNINIY